MYRDGSPHLMKRYLSLLLHFAALTAAPLQIATAAASELPIASQILEYDALLSTLNAGTLTLEITE